MKFIITIFILSLFVPDLNAKVIFSDPVKNAGYVSIYNNIIIGLDDIITSQNLNSLIKVKGSKSGNHNGEIIITSDRKKLIFKPAQPFEFDETVEVKLNFLKTSSSSDNRLSYSFQTQSGRPDLDISKSLLYETQDLNYNVLSSYTDYSNLPSITVSISNNPSPGVLYMSNFPFINVPNTPYLLNLENDGNISYYRQMNTRILDFKKQSNGMLTYFKGDKFYGEDFQYNLIDSFECGNGYTTDLHELQVIENGHALLMSYDPQTVDMSQIVEGGHPSATVVGLIIQEIDENKNVVFQWRSWDHFQITDATQIDLTTAYIDYAHGNAIELDNDGNILISSRHMDEITKISRTTGEIIWRLGGINNQFNFTNDTIKFSYQHDIRRIRNGNITLYDNGNFHIPAFSRAVEYQIDEINKTVTLVWEYRNTPPILGFAMGSVQRLRNGNTLISWGSTHPSVAEVTPEGEIALELSLPQNIFTYRTLRDEVTLTLNIKLAIEGFYDSNTDKLNLKDTVAVYLRNADLPYNIIDSSIAVIDSIGMTGNFRFYNSPGGTYYVTLKHRNGLETWSKQGGETFESGGVYLYDFTNSNLQAYGNNLILKELKYCIYSGDVNQDGNIDSRDLSLVDNDAFNFVNGYVSSDVNGNNVSDAVDLGIVDNNTVDYVSVKKP